MMKSVVLIYSFIFLVLSGCIAAPKNTRKSTTGSATTTTTTTSTNSPTFASDEKLYWFSSSKTVGTITINKNNLNTYYLRGSLIHNFLNSTNSSGVYNYKKQYCLIGNFSSGIYKQVRVRAIPITTTTSTATERMLRIDFPVESDNYAACAKSTIDSTGFAGAAYSLNTVCTSCSGKVTTSNLKLFTINTTTSSLDSIDAAKLTTSSILLQVDLDSNSTTDSASCTNSACSAKGFDCCIEGQCVKDASLKTNASSSADYSQAMSEYNSNPLSFINWPNVFNICSNIAHSPPTSSNSSSTSAGALTTAAERVAAYMKSWYCMEDVSAGTGYSRCFGTTVNGNSTAYEEVRYSLAKACGCTAAQSQMDAKCPNWTVKPLYKNSVQTDENINDFYCYTPIVESQVGSITNLNVSVSARSAPHRFFSEAGDNYDSILGLATTIKQEGDDFYYQDEATKTGPQNGQYNFNSILGRMVVDLSKTAPAKMVTVELGKTYIISATSGYFTPCQLCAKDSWFQSFFAHPNSQKGLGLQYSGYSTTRDAFGNNDTLGNYEDTHFGRACYLPPTMIPLSHQKNSNVQTQRLSRLKTQSAFFINGYQKDWFGFNQGALIGSFDGVTWFGVGSGRRITASSTKLFLAFNAPFLDLATKTDTIVNIIPDSGSNTAPNVDFDPDLGPKDPLQGTAATCQRFHQCVTDAECINQLGWEYVCADVSQMKTTWPVFDSNGNEIKNQEKKATLFDILANTISTTYTKRCVYRGAGAPCKKDFSVLDSGNPNGFNETYRKSLTCAPNFYCASLSSTKFNEELARSPNEMDNIFFGMDANVLGRPLNYVTANKALPDEAVSNITYNGTAALNLSSEASDLGICRPGKGHISSYSESKMVLAHSTADSQKRTDYISQIGSCDSNQAGDSRVLNCPVIGSDNNLIDYKTDHTIYAKQQNMCGGEAKHTSTFISGFKSIESLSLANTSSVPSPTMVLDACLRRAGSICHTDLDCGPNSMHETLANSLNLAYFGGTEAERSYWAETLICGQAEAQPLKSDAKYFSYQLANNRCCREVGKDFTMYTKGDATFIKDQTTTGATTLDTTKFTVEDPTATNRYSRYIIAPSAWHYYSSVDGTEHDDQEIVPQIPLSTQATIHEPTAQQWQVVNETGSKTCCGGGWIRKFADGTHTWPIKNRLTIDTSNFSCLNFRSPLTDATFSSTYSSNLFSGLVGSSNGPSSTKIVSSQSYSKESDLFCKSPADGGCMQIPFKDSANFTIATPDTYFPGDSVWIDTESGDNEAGDLTGTIYSRVDTTPTEDPSASTTWTQRLNVDTPYAPIANVHIDRLDEYQGQALNFIWSSKVGYSTHFYLPTYISWNGVVGSASTTYNATEITNVGSSIANIYIKYVFDSESGKKPMVQRITQYVVTDNQRCIDAVAKTSAQTGYAVSGDNLTAGGDSAAWCIVSDAKTGNRPVVVVRADTTTGGTYDGWKYAGVIIDYKPLEYQLGSYTTDNPANLTITGKKVAVPGNAQYYLTKLARLELLGIPQITYEPIYCSNDHNKLIPGIYKTTTLSPLTSRSEFTSQSYSYSDFDPIESYNSDSSVNDAEQAYTVSGRTVYYGNYENRFVYQNKIAYDPIFSSKDFTCCTPLGKTPKNGTASCCSGYSVTKNNVTKCMLPTGTDINVYFNKFVSNEGVGADQPGGGLISAYITDSDGDGINDISPAVANDNIDFNPFTGEPKYRDSTFKKLYTLGTNYCASGKVASGAIFGSFPPEPFSGSYTSVSSTEYTYPTSIVDSIIDSDPNDPNVGKIMFDQGFRWNNHYYCK